MVAMAISLTLRAVARISPQVCSVYKASNKFLGYHACKLNIYHFPDFNQRLSKTSAQIRDNLANIGITDEDIFTSAAVWKG